MKSQLVTIIVFGCLLFVTGFTTPSGLAQETHEVAGQATHEVSEEEPIYADLLTVRKGLIEAYNARDFDKLLSFCHPNIVITWQNGEVTTGREGLKKYYDKMMTGEDRIVEDLHADPTVDDRAIIYNDDTAISRGAMNDRFTLRDGSQFFMNSRWSATLVKENDKWQVAAFHASTNAFNNEILRLAVKKTAIWTGLIAGIAGLICGFLLAKIRTKVANV